MWLKKAVVIVAQTEWGCGGERPKVQVLIRPDKNQHFNTLGCIIYRVRRTCKKLLKMALS